MKIVLSGATGAMGRKLVDFVSDKEEYEIVLGSALDDADLGFPILRKLSSEKCSADVIIDFSHPSALEDIIDFAILNKIPLLIATTGLEDRHKQLLKFASESVPVLHSGNYSLGINLLKKISELIASELGTDFDVEIIEAHHNKKVDAPSGTAFMLGESIKKARPDLEEKFGRNPESGKRKKNELAYHSIRGGTVVGEHTVAFYGLDEIVEIKHTALSKNLFVVGALRAAKSLIKMSPGLYKLEDLNLMGENNG